MNEFVYSPGVPHLDSHDSLPPVPNKPLSTCLEIRHACVLLHSCLIDHIVIEYNLAIAIGEVFALFGRLSSILTSLTFAGSRVSANVLPLDCKRERGQ